MNRKKVIIKFVKILGIIFVIAVLVLLTQIPYHNWQYKKLVQIREKHVQELTQRYEQILQQIANEIKEQISLSSNMITEENVRSLLKQGAQYRIESRILNSPDKLYLWMSNAEGDFVFGAPSGVFFNLNETYNQNIEIIKKDGHYLNRNDFLQRLVHLHKDIDLSNLQTGFWPGKGAWRFRDEHYESGYWYAHPKCLNLSTLVENNAGKLIGVLYLNVDDVRHRQLYFSKSSFTRNTIYSDFLNPIFETIVVICGLLLWFLMPTWVYVDAKQRDVKNPLGMAILAAAAPLIGLLIYLITRPEYYKSNICPECAKEVNGDLPYCPYCGYNLAANYCPQCQYAIQPDWAYCPSCRADLKAARLEPTWIDSGSEPEADTLQETDVSGTIKEETPDSAENKPESE